VSVGTQSKCINNRKNKGAPKRKNPPKQKNGGASRVRDLEKRVTALAVRGPVYQTRALPRFKKTQPAKGLHPAEHHLIQAMLKPTDKSRPRHGLFTMPHDDSQKGRGFFEYDVTIGTAGIGFVTLNPTVVRDGVQTYYSDILFTGTVPTYSGTGVALGYTNNLPYISTSLSASAPTLYARVVAAGLHASYTGLNQNRGGMVYAFSDPAHANLMGYSVSQLTARKQCSITTVKESSVFHMSVNPFLEEDMAYTTKIFPYSPNQSAIAVMIFQGTPGNTYHVSLVVDVEYIGTITEGIASPNPLVPAPITRNVINAVTKAKELHATFPDAQPTHLVKHATDIMSTISEGSRRASNVAKSVKSGFDTARSIFKTIEDVGEGLGALLL